MSKKNYQSVQPKMSFHKEEGWSKQQVHCPHFLKKKENLRPNSTKKFRKEINTNDNSNFVGINFTRFNIL